MLDLLLCSLMLMLMLMLMLIVMLCIVTSCDVICRLLVAWLLRTCIVPCAVCYSAANRTRSASCFAVRFCRFVVGFGLFVARLLALVRLAGLHVEPCWWTLDSIGWT